MNIANQLLGIGVEITGGLRTLRGRAGNGGFIVETIQVAAGLLEILDPFLWLSPKVSVRQMLVYPTRYLPLQSSCGNRKSLSRAFV